MKNRLQQVLCRMDAMERTAQGRSPLHSLDARAKLLVTVVYLVTMLSVPLGRLSEILLFFLFPMLTAPMAGLSYATLFRRSTIVLPFVALIGVFNIFYDRQPLFFVGSVAVTAGWVTFLSIVLRGLLSVQALLLLVAATGFHALCRSMQQLGVPSLFTTQLLFVYRYSYVLIEESLALSRARDARSFGRKSYPLKVWGTLVGQLLIRTFERSERIGRAMHARGFTGRIPSGLSPRPAWSTRDTVYLAGWSAVLIAMRVLLPVEFLTSMFL